MLKRKNKKGSIQDIIFLGIVILFFAIVTLIAFKVTSEMNDIVQSNSAIADADLDSHARESFTSLTGTFPGVIDNTFLFLAIGMGLVALVLASLVRVHPVFMVFFFIALVIIIFFNGIFSNIYQEMAANSQLAAQANQLLFISTILQFLPLIVGVMGILMMIIMHKINPTE